MELKQWISNDEQPTTNTVSKKQHTEIDNNQEVEEEETTTNKSADAKQMKEDLMKEVEKRANANCMNNNFVIVFKFFSFILKGDIASNCYLILIIIYCYL